MRVEMTDTEMGVLLIKARAGNPLPFSFTANGVCTLDSELPEAAWAIAELAVLRGQQLQELERKPARRPSVSNSVNVGGAMTGSLVQTNEIKGGLQL